MRSLFAALLLLAGSAWALPIPPFISEIHYDNAGADSGEFVELSGADADLAGWALHFYNGATGSPYDVLDLSGLLPAGELTAIAFFPTFSIQNGPADGVVLVNAAGEVVEFIAYEGILLGQSGPADGMQARPLPLNESGDTPLGTSLQRTSMTDPDAWSAVAATPGVLNPGLVALPSSAWLLLVGLLLVSRLRRSA